MAWGSSHSEGPLLALHFPEAGTNGYLYVQTLARGQDGIAVLIRSVDTNKLGVRKLPLSGVADEPRIKTRLTPRYISIEGCEQTPRSLTMQYCQGGTVWDYYNRFLANGARQEREAFLWLVLGECLRAFGYLFTGHTYVPPSATVWTDRVPKGKFVPPSPEFQPWKSIHHTDCHMSNVFLAFDAEVFQVLLADFSRADYKHNFFWGSLVNPELVEVDVFMNSFLSLHPRPSLAIDRKVAEIRRRMEAGTTLLQLLEGGLYDECMQNFRKQGAKLPVPMSMPRRGLPRVFDLSQSSFSYVASLWSLREALKVGTGSYSVLQIPKADVSEEKEVSIARATVLSKRELMRLTGHVDEGDETAEAETADCENELATNDLGCGVLAQEIPV